MITQDWGCTANTALSINQVLSRTTRLLRSRASLQHSGSLRNKNSMQFPEMKVQVLMLQEGNFFAYFLLGPIFTYLSPLTPPMVAKLLGMAQLRTSCGGMHQLRQMLPDRRFLLLPGSMARPSVHARDTGRNSRLGACGRWGDSFDCW